LKAAQEDGGGEVSLLDGGGRVLASVPPGKLLRVLPKELWSSPQARVASRIVSRAKLANALGFFALVSVEEKVALRSLRSLRRTVLGSIAAGLVVLLLFGFAFTQRLNRRIGHAVQGAEAYGRGELSHRIPVTGADELTGLSETFNRMGGELEAARARLTRWNDELRQKVEEATAELRAAQAQLIEAQKLAAVGQLGAGVAHEINNPLAGILGHTQLLMLDRSEQDPDFAALKKIEQSAKRCKEITQNLLRFSQQRDKAELRPTDLNAVVQDALSLSESQLRGEGIALALHTAPGPLRVSGDPAHLTQVILALVSNSRTAMRASAQRELTVSTGERDGKFVLDVKDTGKGISPEHLPRIFEPFFTTKEVWSNVGLGLSVAYRVMSEHQGKIEATSVPGEGATFTLQLPPLR
ncbi:MAG: sensor histidine kinase, partial [Myxococcaceae bacterium]